MLYINYLQESLGRITNSKLFGHTFEEHTSYKQQLLSLVEDII